jgi:hypothetical protein
VRLVLIVAALLTACGEPPAAPPPHDSAADPEYAKTVEQLAALTRQADALFKNGKPDDASALIEQGEPLESQVLSVLHPTLAATQAASDLDDLYGRMLLSNRHFVWAQTLFQKNLARWKYWQPQTDDTARRFKLAESQIAECERGIMKGPAK